jgi:glycosyltransferase involved in cell wall biosynthesis
MKAHRPGPPGRAPSVTIAIPTYNRADTYLPVAFESARRQTWGNTEILIGDNASTDGTGTYVRGVRDSRVRLVQHESNIGANANFNSLLAEAKGEWFLLLHDDDTIDEDFVEICMSTLDGRRDVGFIRTGVRSIDHAGRVLKEVPNRLLGPTVEDFFRSWFRCKTALFLCNTLYNAERLREAGGFHSQHNLLEDNYALVRLIDRWAHSDYVGVKASYRYTFDQRSYREPVSHWCQDYMRLLDMIVDVCGPSERASIRREGAAFFDSLCVKYANHCDSNIQRLIGRTRVARYFGIRSLRRPWG